MGNIKLSNCISSWGGVSLSKLDKLHKVQKKMIRIIFGDTDAYKDKFRTCARSRPFGEQTLGAQFYMKEHTKPLFDRHNILTIQNLYYYHCFLDVFKILKYQSPVSLHSSYTFSKRKYLTYITLNPPNVSNHFIYRSSLIWNTLRQKLDITDLSTRTGTVKNILKQKLHNNQHRHDKLEWLPSHDFNIKIIKQK